MKAGSYAAGNREPGQIRKEAALSEVPGCRRVAWLEPAIRDAPVVGVRRRGARSPRPPDATIMSPMVRDSKITERSREARDSATVADIAYGAPDGDVKAYLIEPAGDAVGAGVLFLHWFDPEAPDGNRTQFVEEAVALADRGVVSLLPQGAFPWDGDPTDSEADIARIEAHLARIRAGLDILESRGADRLGVVAHDFGAMYAALLAARDRRPVAYALIAGTPRWGDWFLPFWKIDEDRHDYLRAMSAVDPIVHVGAAEPAEILFQFASDDFYIAHMTAREFAAQSSEPKSISFYEADHAMSSPEAASDRFGFLARTLGFGLASAG